MKMLVVVDMQNDFITGVLGNEQTKAVVPNVVKRIQKSIADNDKIYFTKDTHYADYLTTIEGKKLPVPHCMIGTVGWELIPEIKDLHITDINENTIEKDTFGSTNLIDYIIDNVGFAGDISDIESITIIGVCTDICVISNAMLLKAYFLNTPIIVDSSCCAGVTEDSHNNALNAMKMCHIDII
jgi:nicotinamidase-related amidase